MKNKEIIIIENLVNLIELWMNGILKNIGFTWITPPPAIVEAKKYLEEHNNNE